MRFNRYLFTAVTTVLSLLSLPAQAANLFGTTGIQFDQDTAVDFTFAGSNGAYKSTLKIFEDDTAVADLFTVFQETKPSDNGSDNSWQGTCGAAGSAVLTCTNSFEFLAGKKYTFGLESVYINPANSAVSPKPTVYSTNLLNGGSQQAMFGGYGTPGAKDGVTFDASTYQSADPFAGPVKIAFDDGGNGNDKDFNDFRFTAAARKAVPEPGTLAGLGLAVGALAIVNRRKTSKQV